MNLEPIVAAEQETYPDQYEKGADGAKDSFGWWDGRVIFREVHGRDGLVQR